MKKTKIDHYTDKEALEFHNSNKSGKIEIISSKPMTTKRDLALAYSPGVAAPVKEIAKNPDAAYDYTTKGNLVAVISNGSAILGMGNLGALASKPVMEGKAVLFKRFADIDAIDLEIESSDLKGLFKTNFNRIIRGNYKLKKQNLKKGSYFSRESVNYSSLKKIKKIDNKMSTHNLIRSLIFPAFQLPIYKGKKIKKSIYINNKIKLFFN